MHRIWHQNELIKALLFFIVVCIGLGFLLAALRLPTVINCVLAFTWGVLLQQFVSDQWELFHWERDDEGSR